MNPWYALLTKDQIDNIYKNQKRQIGKYFALWSESGHLNKFMVTLSPTKNSLLDTIKLRKDFFKKLNNVKNNKKFKVAYFSAIEIGLNKNPPSYYIHMIELNRVKAMKHNYHLHIQLFTDMDKTTLQGILNKIDVRLCVFNMISIPKKKSIKYDYVIKDIKTIDWQLQHMLKTQHKGKIIYTSSRKQLANYMITKLWGYMKKTYQDKWTKDIKDKYLFIMNLKKNNELILSNHTNKVKPNMVNIFDVIQVQGKVIYIKKNLL